MEKSNSTKNAFVDEPFVRCRSPECQESSILSSVLPLSPNRVGHRSNADQTFTTFDTPLRKGGYQHSFCSSSSTCLLMKDQTYHVAGMDILTYKRNCSASETRRERYDPCCTSYSPTKSQLVTSTLSFDHDILASANRKRAQSDFLKKSNSCAASKHNTRKYNSSNCGDDQVKSRQQQRKYSKGPPLIGTTVLVGCSSKDSFDCGSSSDETISSIETPGELSNNTNNNNNNNNNCQRTPASRKTTGMNKDNGHETCLTRQSVPMWSSPYLMNIPTFFLGSRRRRSKILNPLRADSTSSSITNNHQHNGYNVRPSDFDACAAANLGKDASRLQRRVMQFMVMLFMGIVLFSNTTTTTTNTRDHNQIRHKPTESGTTGEIRTVKNFSGAWGLTLSDSEEEHDGHELLTDGNLRRKRRPKLSQANSLHTQQLSSPIQSTTFVLTDDEIKQKTKALDEHNKMIQYRNKIFHFVWGFLALMGIGMAWFQIGMKCRRTRLMARPVGTLNNRYSR